MKEGMVVRIKNGPLGNVRWVSEMFCYAGRLGIVIGVDKDDDVGVHFGHESWWFSKLDCEVVDFQLGSAIACREKDSYLLGYVSSIVPQGGCVLVNTVIGLSRYSISDLDILDRENREALEAVSQALKELAEEYP